ncbi:hypothetical protein EON81_22670, partial [bacterium]
MKAIHRKADPAPTQASIPTLIYRLEDAKGSTGLTGRRVTFRNHPIVIALAAQGNEAVPALLDALENDERLTRGVTIEDYSDSRALVPVTQPVLDALNLIANVRELPGLPDQKDRKSVVAIYRKFFETTKGQNSAQRALALLREQDAPWTWVEVAKNLMTSSPLSALKTPDDERAGTPRLLDALTPFERTEVVALLERRFGELDEKGNDPVYTGAMADLAITRILIHSKDPDDLLKRTTDRSFSYLAPQDARTDSGGAVARAFRMRIRRGDTMAITEYENWLKRICERAKPGWLDLQWLAPLRDLDENEALVPIATWVLNATESPFRREHYSPLVDWDGRSSSSIGPIPRLV